MALACMALKTVHNSLIAMHPVTDIFCPWTFYLKMLKTPYFSMSGKNW